MEGNGEAKQRPVREPASARTYVALALPLALVVYLLVQVVYLWELERAGALVRTFDLSRLLVETVTVHGASLAAWLVIAAACGYGVHRAAMWLYEAQRELVTQREHQALKDPLTQLDNRRAMEERLAVLHPIAERSGRPYSVLSIDADGLKDRNDADGHEAGDRAIRRMAASLRATMRAEDHCVRLGGDEFIVLLPETSAAGAEIVASRIRQRVEAATLTTRERPVTTTVSVGVASYPEHAADLESVMERADQALYASKSGGRNRVTVAPGRAAYAALAAV